MNVLPKIWSLAFKINRPTHNHFLDIDYLEAYQIKEYIIDLKKKGILTHIPDEVYDRMNYLSMENSGYSQDQLVTQWITLLANFEKEKSVHQIWKFITQFKKKGITGDYFSLYFKLLLKDGQIARVKELLSLSFDNQELEKIYDIFILFDFENGSNYGEDLIPAAYESNTIAKLYKLIKKNELCSAIPLPKEQDLPQKIEINGKTLPIQNFFIEQFFNGIISLVSG